MSDIKRADTRGANLTRRALLTAPLALVPLAATAGKPSIVLRPMEHGLANAYALTGTLAATRLHRIFERKEVTFDGKRYEPVCLVWTDKGTSLFLRRAA